MKIFYTVWITGSFGLLCNLFLKAMAVTYGPTFDILAHQRDIAADALFLWFMAGMSGAVILGIWNMEF